MFTFVSIYPNIIIILDINIITARPQFRESMETSVVLMSFLSVLNDGRRVVVVAVVVVVVVVVVAAVVVPVVVIVVVGVVVAVVVVAVVVVVVVMGTHL